MQMQMCSHVFVLLIAFYLPSTSTRCSVNQMCMA